jgi:hypothetical protein
MSDSDSDEWATNDLSELDTRKQQQINDVTTHDSSKPAAPDTDDFDDWQSKLAPEPEPASTDSISDGGEPMILCDFTKLSNNKIHSRVDANSVNDPAAVATLRRSIGRDYAAYANNSLFVADRTVVPCGSSVWKSALQRLRQEVRGHYFCPIFPPKK